MNFPSSLIKNAVDAISNFPGIGKKTALRLAVYLLRNKKQAQNISQSIKEMIEQTTYCQNCYNIFVETVAGNLVAKVLFVRQCIHQQ